MALDDPQSYVGRRPDGIWERELRREQPAMPEDERFAFLLEVLRVAEHKGFSTRPWLEMARKHVSKPHFVEILRLGLGIADASTIRNWLDFSAARLGCRRLLTVLEEEERTRPDRVALTYDWLPSVAKTDDDRTAIKAFVSSRGR